MALGTFELVGQQTSGGKTQTARQLWHITGTWSATLARELAWAASPPVFDHLVRQSATIDELGGGQWKVSVDYGERGSDDAASISWSFEIGTSSLHITQAKEHIGSYDLDGGRLAGAHKGAIGVSRDGNAIKVEGCEIVYPVFSWEETHNIPAAMVSSFAWLRRMELLTGRINHAVFRTWQRGELLFMGCSGQHTGGLEKNCPVTFKFSSSRTATNMTIGDITGVHKEGHHYLWIEYQEGEIENRLILTKRPRAVYIERVYDYGDFTLLGINTPWR